MTLTSSFDAPWMHLPLVKAVEAALGPANVRFVGGAVRDTLKGLPIKDIDIATALKPDAVVAALEEADIQVALTGLQHGTVTAHGGGSSVEVTTLRVDMETDGRHAVVAYTDDWQKDAERRDFTINALYVDPYGRLYDPVGGAHDLQAGLVRFIGNAKDRIEEDGLRILRFFRFYAHYGRGPVDADVLSVMRAKAGMIAKLSVERVRDEIFKLLAAGDPLSALQMMDQAGLIKPIFGMPIDLSQLAQALSAETSHPIRALRRLAALLPEGQDTLREFAAHFKLSVAQRKHLLAVGAARDDVAENQYGVRALQYLYGREPLLDAFIIARPKLLATWNITPDSIFPLMGRDLIALGVEPGVEMGAMLDEAKIQWLTSDCQLDQAELLSLLQSHN